MTPDSFSDSLVPLEVYLSPGFQPDCEFDEGFLSVRNMGQGEHEAIVEQIAEVVLVSASAASSVRKLKLVANRRLVTGEHRYRVPDICLLDETAVDDRILTEPPFAILEILAPGESLPVLCAKTMEYLESNVAHVWIIDPQSHTAYIVSFEGLEEVEEGLLSIPESEVRLDLQHLLADLS